MGETISLCMIVRNEEKNLRRCLNSVQGAVDEIIVVDTGSSDATTQVAAEYGALVQSFIWNDNFSDARNLSLELASGDWILFLDADEELEKGSIATLRRSVGDKTADGYFIKIINYLGNEDWPEFAPDLVFRLFRNRPEYRFHGAIHEQIVDVILEKNHQASYKTVDDVVILHYGYLDDQIAGKKKKQRNLLLLEQEISAAPDSRILRYHYGIELYRNERYDQAAASLTKAADGIDPQTIYLPKLLRYLMLSYHAANRRQDALKCIDSGLRLFPDYADLYYYQGVLHYENKDYGLACKSFRQALAAPEQPAYYSTFCGIRGFRAHYYLGQIAEKFGNMEEAMRCYILSLHDNPQFLTALQAVTRLLTPREDPDYAGYALTKLCDFCTPQANLLMARILLESSAFRLALDFLNKASLQEQPPTEVCLWQAVCLMQQRRFFEALRLIELFEPGHPLYPQARLNKLLCFFIQGTRQKMRSVGDELFNLGLSLDTGTIVSLLQTQQLTSMAPKQLGDEGTVLLLDILTRLMDLNEWEKAEILLAGLTKEWLNANCRQISQLYYRFGNDSLAERYLYLMPPAERTAEEYSLLAEIKTKAGHLWEASALLRQAIALEPKEPAYYTKLITMYDTMRSHILEQVPHNTCPGESAKESLCHESND